MVVFTSSGDPQLVGQCLALGAREFKVKPTDYTELVEVVHRALDHWATRTRKEVELMAAPPDRAPLAQRA